MVFSSPTFLFAFLPISLAIYFLSGRTAFKNISLLLLSLIFYAWGEPWFVLVMLGLTALNYFAAIAIDDAKGRLRPGLFVTALSVNLGILGAFKYAAFAVTSLNAVAGLTLQVPEVELPLGISFFTFHCMSYLIDIYRGQFSANRKFSEMALYIALFPQLIAGPIVRYKTIARQLSKRRHTIGRASIGMRIFIIGLAQKILIADEVARIADAVFNANGAQSLADSWLGTLAYTLQIYFDFAGYSNMAIGLGFIFGFALPRNFNLPYTSRSITEFWRRWHMSLSAWFRDYLYIPLGGNRLGPLKTYRNLLIVFLLCGLWHGASWAFVVWGLYHGFFLVLERIGLGRLLKAVPLVLSWAWTLLVVMVGWVFFRADTLSDAMLMLQSMFGMRGEVALSEPLRAMIAPLQMLVLGAGIALAMIPRRKWRLVRTDARGAAPAIWRGASSLAQATGATLLLVLALLSISGGTYSPFLYFRF
ncbi:MAG: MBOAT family protein [Hyphomonadaceae bacterium]|nr:MBOAT family protein [Hyphomonadaceae bacterium]